MRAPSTTKPATLMPIIALVGRDRGDAAVLVLNTTVWLLLCVGVTELEGVLEGEDDKLSEDE
jgi:hypothetical protein